MARHGKPETSVAVTWWDLAVIWYRPWQTFLRMRSGWAWLPPYALLVACLFTSQFIVRDRIEESLRALTAITEANAAGSLVRAAVKVNIVAAPLIQPLSRAFLFALLVSLVAALSGILHRFGKVYSLVVWSLLPSLGLGTVIKSILLAMNPNLLVDGVRTDLLFLVPLTPGSVAFRLVGALDLFLLWSIGLLSVGFVILHKCAPRVGYGIGAAMLAALTGLSLAWPG